MAIESKKARRASRSGLTLGFPDLYFCWFVLIYYLTGEVLVGMPSGSSTANLLIMPAAIILPMALLIYVLINVRKLIIDRRHNRPGARFKTHLILFFSMIVFLSSIPQTLVSMKFVNTAINTWFSPEIGKAINGGLTLSLAYYNEKIDTLVDFAEGPVFNQMLSDLERSPQRMWTNIHNANPGIDSIQIFDEAGHSAFFSGGTDAEMTGMPLA